MNKLAIFNDNQQENIPDKHGLVQNLKGRGSSSNRTGRYEKKIQNFTDDGWLGHKEFKSQTNIKTTLTKDKSKTIIVYNTSPDISFDRSIIHTAAANMVVSIVLLAQHMHFWVYHLD